MDIEYNNKKKQCIKCRHCDTKIIVKNKELKIEAIECLKWELNKIKKYRNTAFNSRMESRDEQIKKLEDLKEENGRLKELIKYYTMSNPKYTILKM
jgi:DNA-directed RNA polymerase subunit RPC12/RpoP